MSSLDVAQVRQSALDGLTDAEIGNLFGYSRRVVNWFRKQHGIPAARPVGKTRRGELPVPVPAEALLASADAPLNGKKPITITEFLMNKKRAVCPVCKLREPVKSLVLDAKKKGERQSDILEYLQAVHHIAIAPREFMQHFTGRHDA